MKYYINKWSDFILNETLRTTDIDITINNVFDELQLSGINCNLTKNENKILLELFDFDSMLVVDSMFDYICSLFIDRNGWFPSIMKITKTNGKMNTLKYDQDFIIQNQNNIQNVVITYEPKYDIVKEMPEKLYHISILSYKDKILKNGLIPKSKNKKSIHLDRIYLCKTIESCKYLINDMKYLYNKQKLLNIDDEIKHNWVIFEIDCVGLNLKLYNDSNYKYGYYIVDNIKPENITICEEESDI